MRPTRPTLTLLAVAVTLAAGVGAATSTGQPGGTGSGLAQAGPHAVVARTSIVAPTPKPSGSPKPTPIPSPSPVPTPTPEPIPTKPVCKTGAASHGSKAPKVLARVLTVDGVVEIRGTRTLLTVESCVGRNALPTQEFTLVKAPKTKRYIAVMTVIPTRSANGNIGIAIVDLARPETERAFDRAIPKPKVKLQLPRTKGTVFAKPGTPLEMLATHRNGKKISQDAKQKAAKAYLLTGGVVSGK